jgi:hypothetical protein
MDDIAGQRHPETRNDRQQYKNIENYIFHLPLSNREEQATQVSGMEHGAKN